MRCLIPLVVAILLSVPGSLLADVTIDNFEEGPFSHTRGSFQGITQTGLSTTNVVSGERSVGLQGGRGVVTELCGGRRIGEGAGIEHHRVDDFAHANGRLSGARREI